MLKIELNIYIRDLLYTNLLVKNMSLSCLANVKRTDDNTRPDVPPHVVFGSYVGDRSGSMESQKNASANGVYDWVVELSKGIVNNGQKGYLSVTFFDDVIEKRMDNVDASQVEISMAQAREWSEPRSMTKLYDTAIMCINTLRKRIKSYKKEHPHLKVHGVFQCFSDGMDNSSVASRKHLNDAITKAREEGIMCVYLGIGQDAELVGQSYGFDRDQSLTVDVGEQSGGFAFRSANLNALRSVTQGTTPAFTQCMRQTSAPSTFHNISPPSSPVTLPSSPLVPPNLRQSALPPPRVRRQLAYNLRQPAYNFRQSTLNPTATPFVPNSAAAAAIAAANH